LILFGASVFGSRRSPPEGFQIDHSVRRSGQRVMGFFVLNLGAFGALKTRQKRPGVWELGRWRRQLHAGA